MARVLGVLAGRDMPLDMLRRWAENAQVVLAADAGADLLQAVGIEPDAVVGDLDSLLGDRARATVRHDPSQDSTDCDKLLMEAIAQGHSEITLVCVEGDQLDHMLATLHSAARHPIRVRVALRTGIGWVLNGGDEVRVETEPGARVSLLPLSASEEVSLAGVEWPLDRREIAPLGPTSISNRAVGRHVVASVGRGAAFLFVEFPKELGPRW